MSPQFNALDTGWSPTSLSEPEVAATCYGVRFPMSPMLHDKRIERLNAGTYEGQEIRGALHVVRKGDRVLELGAGIGAVGAVVAKTAEPAVVASFEANPDLIEHVEALYRLNGLDDRIGVTNRVLMAQPDRPETVSFYIANSYLGSSLIDRADRATRKVSVPTSSFADTVAVLRPNVLLMDIEGGELDILTHADLGGFRALVLEFHPAAYGVEGMRRCKDMVKEAGFERIEGHSSRLVWTCERTG
ncbi:FkbM family methyltransferase [Pseudooceanicola sp. 216_PA32_1]|uniref:FkbM family methyltransferase n=1 Tax=Pseudooceanicola pacificus TaxID=2676438 RepID=A0A844W5P3_9RHOB|nr:FkbM family methyltransferase [Pseudooceanicola pacificus]MWB79606.1 FkbM family methyltransferase [Pseudooceanicola pacificus]